MVEIYESGDHPLDEVADAVVVFREPAPRNRAGRAVHGLCKTGDDFNLAEQTGRSRGEHAARELDDAHRVLTGDEFALAVALAAAEAGQDEGGAAGDEVAAVELGGDMDG